MSVDRLKEKSELHFQLGQLFGPLLRLIEHPDQYDSQEKAETLARYYAEYGELKSCFERFSLGQPGHNYAVEYLRFQDALEQLRYRLVHQNESLENVVRSALPIAQAAIDAIPVPRMSVIMEAGSPFTTYCKLRQLCEVDASKTLVWLDPYMGAGIFHRYLSSVRVSVPVTLVTSEPGPHAGKQNIARWTEFLDVSRLYAQERGISSYRLVVQPNLHDRWVVFDDKRIYSLGGSAKDAGSKDYFTITSVDASEIKKIQDHIVNGTEWFGPTTPTHR
jgi:hypothetical protein